MKIFGKDLKEHAGKVKDYQKKRNYTINLWKNKYYKKQKNCYICKKGSSKDDNNKKYLKVRYHCHYNRKHRGDAYNICILRYNTPK